MLKERISGYTHLNHSTKYLWKESKYKNIILVATKQCINLHKQIKALAGMNKEIDSSS